MPVPGLTNYAEKKMKTETAGPRGLVFNVQGYTVHDGPGIRTEFFLKGCSLACEWCSNPEGLKAYAETGIDPDKCIGLDECGLCLRACKQEALLATADGIIAAIDRTKCIHCLKCTKLCPPSALKAWGEWYTVDDVMAVVERDRAFHEKTGGGITISGGEALLQPEFVRAVFERCQDEGVHTVLESALNVPAETVEMIIPYCDMIICDIKTMNSEEHRRRCGAGNELILENIKRIEASGTPLVIRTPVLKGFNATEEDMRAIGEFILNELHNNVLQYQLLPWRALGTEKYKSLNIPYPMEDFEGYEREEWEPDFHRFLDLLCGMGINAVTGMNQKLPSVRKRAAASPDA